MTCRRLDYTTFSVDIGVTDMTKNSRLLTVTSTKCFTLLFAVFFTTHRHPASASPAHPVSVPIHASDERSVVTSFETRICIHREYNEIPGTCAVYTHAGGVWVVFLEYGCGALGIFKSPAFTYNQSWPPFRCTLFVLPKQRSGRRMPPAERRAL